MRIHIHVGDSIDRFIKLGKTLAGKPISRSAARQKLVEAGASGGDLSAAMRAYDDELRSSFGRQ